MLALGYWMNFGLQFPDLDGPTLLMRRQVCPGELEDWCYVGAGDAEAVTIRNASGVSHEAYGGYEYMAARTFGSGYCGEWSAPVRVDFDGGGDIITPALPTWPRDVRAEPLDGGKFRVTWTYEPCGQGNPPTDFAVYVGNDSESISYVAAMGTVEFDPARTVFSYTTGAYGDGIKRAFAVRSRNGGVCERNEFTTENVVAVNATPSAAVIRHAIITGAE